MNTDTAAPAALELPIPQITSAWLLARAFGHEWAVLPYPDTTQWPGPRTVEGIRESTRSGRGDSPFSGIEVPDEYQGEGESNTVILWHRTGGGSGRLSWQVAPDGGVVIDVWRPGMGRPVLSASTVGEPRYQAVKVTTWDPHLDDDFNHRHLVALHEALVPLCGVYASLVALAPLWAQALPDEDATSQAVGPIGNGETPEVK